MKKMIYYYACHLRREVVKESPSEYQFQIQLKNTPELHTIKTKPIPRHYTNIHTKKDLKDQIEKEYLLVLKYTRINSTEFIYNIDEKGY